MMRSRKASKKVLNKPTILESNHQEGVLEKSRAPLFLAKKTDSFMKGNLLKGVIMFTFLVVAFLVLTVIVISAVFIGVFGGFGLFVVADVIVAIWIFWHIFHHKKD